MKEKLVQIKSLSQQVRWQLTLLGIGLFLASLVSSSLFAMHAIETTTQSLVKLEAESIVRDALANPDRPLPVGEMDAAYRQWSEIPLVERRLFADESIEQPPPIRGKILETVRLTDDGRKEYVYLFHHVDEEFGDLFLLSRHAAVDIETTGLRFFVTTLAQSFGSTLIIFSLLFLLIRWIIKRTSEPLVLLSQWAGDLGKNPTLPLKTDFPIKELNDLAAQLREGVDKIETFNRREQEFLRYASHELRTPLGIIQASLDTLALQAEDKEKRPLSRALKASDNVRQLCSALLWLARESNKPIEQSIVNIRETIDKVIDNYRYLLRGRDVDLKIDYTTDSLVIEKDLFTIVVSNLIKNAFQYSADGNIEIIISPNRLQITNISADTEVVYRPESDAPLESFGLGLQLVQRICQKLLWHFEFNENSHQVSVSINW